MESGGSIQHAVGTSNLLPTAKFVTTTRTTEGGTTTTTTTDECENTMTTTTTTAQCETTTFTTEECENTTTTTRTTAQCENTMTTLKCYATEDKYCTKHNIKLERRKERQKYWGETSVGTRKWKYRLVNSWYCKCSDFKALPKPDPGECES